MAFVKEMRFGIVVDEQKERKTELGGSVMQRFHFRQNAVRFVFRSEASYL